jgi:hypothetical protein
VIPFLLATLAVTLLVELLVVGLSARGGLRAPALRTCLFANLLTQPLASYLVLLAPGGGAFVAIELGVVLAEVLAFRLSGRLSWPWALRLAVRANALTIALSIWLS